MALQYPLPLFLRLLLLLVVASGCGTGASLPPPHRAHDDISLDYQRAASTSLVDEYVVFAGTFQASDEQGSVASSIVTYDRTANTWDYMSGKLVHVCCS